MFDDNGLRMMELAGKGYCCTQVMVHMALDALGRENPDLLRASAGLCVGMGDCSGPCGVYTGAALMLGLYAGKGTDMEDTGKELPLMLEELRDWFVEATMPFGGTMCGDIIEIEGKGKCGKPHPTRCASLLGDGCATVFRILADHGFDLNEGRDLP